MASQNEKALDVALEAARAAGALLRAELHRPGGPRAARGKAIADMEAEELIRKRIDAAFPDHDIVGPLMRERRSTRNPERFVWVLDANNGSPSFVRGMRGSAVSIALLRAGKPVVGVVFAFAAPTDSGDLFAWAEGCGPMTRNERAVVRTWPVTLDANHTVLISQDADVNSRANAELVAPARFRCVPSIAYRLALVAAGEGEAAVSLKRPRDWDFAAGHALLQAAGGRLLNQHGNGIVYDAFGISPYSDVFGGSPGTARALAFKKWSPVFLPSVDEPPEYPLVESVPGQRVSDAGRLARGHGCLLGQLAGDALGSQVEFQDAEMSVTTSGLRRMKDGGTWNTLAGQPTGDSELALMLARGVISEGSFKEDAVARAYAHWYRSGPFNIGNTTKVALSAAAWAVAHKDRVAESARRASHHTSQTNGALMRVSPLGILGHGMLPDEVARIARLDAALTHPNVLCVDASVIFSVTLAYAISSGENGAAVYRFAVDWSSRNTGDGAQKILKDAEKAPPSSYNSAMSNVGIALQNAFYQLLRAPSLERGVTDTILAGGDTGTNAAVAGALLGAVHGRAAIPNQWRDRVLTCRPLDKVPGVNKPRPKEFWPVDALEIAERLLYLGRAPEPWEQTK